MKELLWCTNQRWLLAVSVLDTLRLKCALAGYYSLLSVEASLNYDVANCDTIFDHLEES